MIPSRVAALTGAAAAGNDAVVHAILVPPRERPLRTDGIGVNSREQSSLKTALHYAILNDRLSTVELLLELGADLTAADLSGQTALHMCVGLRRHAILRALLKAAGREPEVLERILCARDRLGRSAHHLAARHGDRAELALLLDAAGEQTSNAAKRSSGLLDAPDSEGNTALRLAAARACEVTGPPREIMCATMDQLLRRGADPNVVDNEGETLLGWCARNDCPFMVRKLLRDFDGTYGPKVDPSIEDRTYRRTPLDWCTLQEDAPPGEGPAPFRPACAIALVEGGAPVAQRHGKLLAKARSLPALPISESEQEKSLVTLHARLRTAYLALDEDACARLPEDLKTMDGTGAGKGLGLLEFHGALRRYLKARPSQVNDHDVGVVFKYLCEAHGNRDKRAQIHDFVTWLNTSRFRVVSRGVMATRRFTAVLRNMGHTPPSAPGLGLDGLSPPLTPDAPAAHLGHAFEPALAAPPLPAEYRIGDTIGEMAWKRSGWQRSQQNAHHLFLSATPKKLKPILDKRKALSDGAKPRGNRSLAALFDDEAGPRTRRPRGGLAESASVPGAFDDDASLATVGSLRSMPF